MLGVGIFAQTAIDPNRFCFCDLQIHFYHFRQTELARVIPHLSVDPVIDVTQTVAALCITELHIHIRFAEYLRYPYALWRLCSAFNPTGYVDAAETFLDTAECDLDTGYSYFLKRDAVRSGSWADALAFLLTRDVQDELRQLFAHTEATSLPVERKNYADRRGLSKDKSMSAARASRNSILQQYRAWRLPRVREQKACKKIRKRLKHVNSQSLAVMRRPQDFPRAAGQLHWQPKRSNKARQQIVHAGNAQALQQYREDNRLELEAEARRVRAAALRQELISNSDLPCAADDWLVWMKKHTDFFHQVMQVASSDRQEILSKRLEPLPNVEQVSRVGPKLPVLPPWVHRLKSCKKGPFFLIRWDAHRQVVANI